MQLIEYCKEENSGFRAGKAKTQKILRGDESDHDVHTSDQTNQIKTYFHYTCFVTSNVQLVTVCGEHGHF